MDVTINILNGIKKILEKERLRREMIRAQEINSKPMATEKIYHHLKKLSGEE